MASSIDYNLDLQTRLADKSYAVGYLNECSLENDSALVCLALSDVIKAHSNLASFFISAYARYLSERDIQKLQTNFPELRDYFDNHQEVLGAIHTD